MSAIAVKISQFDTVSPVDPCNASNSIGTYDPNSGGGDSGSDCCTFTKVGYKALATTHTFNAMDIPALSKTYVSGELALYLQNPGSSAVNVTLCLFARGNGTGTAVIYQKVGNFATTNGVVLDVPNFSSTGNLVFTYNPAAECRWIFRGF